jgi:antitoxin component of MazEF toxin-antitoxin module
MNTINTTLTTSGNSVAVRLPKELLRMSGLGSNVTLEAKQGKIIISKPTNTRANWAAQIKTLVATEGEPTREFNDLSVATHDDFEDLPWDGPSFEDWQTTNAKLS